MTSQGPLRKRRSLVIPYFGAGSGVYKEREGSCPLQPSPLPRQQRREAQAIPTTGAPWLWAWIPLSSPRRSPGSQAVCTRPATTQKHDDRHSTPSAFRKTLRSANS